MEHEANSDANERPFEKILKNLINETMIVSCWLVGWFYGISILFGSFNTELNFKQFSLV